MEYSIGKQLRSFGFAFKGILQLFRTQQNARVQLLVSIIVILASAWFSIEKWEWCVVILCIGIVTGMEAINTAIEKLCDKLHPGLSESIGLVKDVAAGAVLIVSIIAVIVGLIIFVPHLIALAG